MTDLYCSLLSINCIYYGLDYGLGTIIKYLKYGKGFYNTKYISLIHFYLNLGHFCIVVMRYC